MSTPQVNSSAPVAPTEAAPPQAAPAPIPQATQVTPVAQPAPAPAAKRSRNPRGPIPDSTGLVTSSGMPALLEIGAAAPFHTVQRRSVNYFLPDANFLFFVLSICDTMMNSTHRFTQSAPSWIPIVSQLYISILWWYQIIKVYVNSGYGLQFATVFRELSEILNLDTCLIPGPLVPFFESLGAINGPFDWIGDVVAALPNLENVWDPELFIPTTDARKRLPYPVVLLDQLAYFASWTVPAQQTVYGNFEWYRNIFSGPSSANNGRLRSFMLCPTGSGSLYTTTGQNDAARSFWNSALSGFTRVNSAEGNPPLNNFLKLFGFVTQNGTTQINWFQQVAEVMQKYCLFFNGSKQLKFVSPTGLGACIIQCKPENLTVTKDWLYPRNLPSPFLSSRFLPINDIPSGMFLNFSHNDHELEEVAEQYALTCVTNVKWGHNIPTQNNWPVMNDNNVYDGTIWSMTTHRECNHVNMKAQYAQIIASRYHVANANKTV